MTTAAPLPVAIVEDDESYRRFLRRLLDGSGRRYRCVGAWGSVETALMAVVAAAPRLVLLDIALPGLPGYAAVPRLRELLPGAPIVMLTGIGHDDVVFESLRVGAAGYILKTEEPGALLAALDDALAGGAPMSPAIARLVVASFARRPPQPVPTVESPGAADLTPREREVLEALAVGLSYKEIALRLAVSPATVKNHLANVYSKLQVRSRTEAILKWLKPRPA